MNELPTAFGKYYLTEKLAVGGMAEIYLAKLIGPGGFEKRLIIKQIHPELSDQPQFVDLFVREAKTLVSLTHGNIVPIYELGVVDDRYFIAMEYIDGPTLSELQTAVREAGAVIAPHIAAYIAAELLKGLDYAHRRGDGVIHRDLSPRNVMISREGEVKLVDFGIAVGLDQQKAREGRPEGSFPYMSPEQVRGEPLTGQSDLFSAGVLLWETVAGRSLFVRDDADATLRAVLEAEIPPPSSVVAGAAVPEALDAICARALARDASARFASAGEFSSKLNRYLYSQDEPVSPSMLSRLVARHCPPIVKRAPAEPSSQVTPVRAEDDGVDRTMPHPRGKRRAGTQTFATSVQFENQVLAKATPLFPIQAITDEMLGAKTDPDSDAEADTGEAPAGEAAAETVHMRKVAPVAWLPIVGALLLVGGAVAVFFVLRGGASAEVRRMDAAVVSPVAIDAGVMDAGLADAGAVDAGHPDARVRVRRRADAAPAVRGKATLRVGARPWALVYLGNRELGRAPGIFTIPAGTHTVRIELPNKASETRRITARDGQEVDLGMFDFTDR